MCVLLVSSTKQSRDETSPVIKEFSVKNEISGIIKGRDHHSLIEISENVAYSAVEQKSSLVTPPVYETINLDNSSVYERINECI